MKKILWAPLALSLSLYVGCGGGDKQTAAPPPNLENQAAAVGSKAPNNTGIVTPTDPKEIVRTFLNAMRAGDGEQLAALFSSAARAEIQKQGIRIEPPGSAQATFEIGDAVARGDAILVSSMWKEPTPEGQAAPQEMEVVWVLRKELAGWRVCEMAVDPGTGDELEIVNFEKLDPPDQETVPPPASRMASLPGAPTAGQLPPGQLPLPTGGQDYSNGQPNLPTGNSVNGATGGMLPPAPTTPYQPVGNNFGGNQLPPAPVGLPPSPGYPNK